MKELMYRLTAICVGICICFGVAAQRRNTTAKHLKPLHEAKTIATEADTLVCSPGDLVFSGYDKTLRANKETFFVSNHTSTDIFKIIFRIEYFDMQGRQLHLRRCERNVEIPAGDTRCIDIPTWDKQGSFYFIGSRRPRVSGVPYSVKINADTIIIPHKAK